MNFKTTIAFWLLAVCVPVTHAQSTWKVLPNAPYNNGLRIDDVYFINAQEGWCATSFGKIAHTTDGGLTWEDQYIGPAFQYFRCIEFWDHQLGFAGTLDKKLLRTLDGGATWANVATQISPVPEAICGVDIADSITVYAVGEWDSPAHFLKSTDKGTTWTRKNMSAFANALVDINFISRDTGFVSGKNGSGGVILYTTDGGETWTQKVNTNKIGEYIWKMQRVTENVWVASIQSGHSGRMLKSTDNGQTWNFINTPLTETQGIGFATPEHGWIGGYIAGLYETTDGGTTWNYLPVGGNFNRFFFINAELGFASGATVYKFSSDSIPSSVDNRPYRSDDFDFTISPNPTSGNTTIEFDLLRKDIVRITLVSIDGAEKKVLFSDRLDAGHHSIPVNMADMPAGQWFVRIQRNIGLRTKPLMIH